MDSPTELARNLHCSFNVSCKPQNNSFQEREPQKHQRFRTSVEHDDILQALPPLFFLTNVDHRAPPSTQLDSETPYDDFDALQQKHKYRYPDAHNIQQLRQRYQQYSLADDADVLNEDEKYQDAINSGKTRTAANGWHAMMSRSTASGSQGLSLHAYSNEDDEDALLDVQGKAAYGLAGRGPEDDNEEFAYALDASAAPWYGEHDVQQSAAHHGEQYQYAEDAQQEDVEHEEPADFGMDDGNPNFTAPYHGDQEQDDNDFDADQNTEQNNPADDDEDRHSDTIDDTQNENEEADAEEDNEEEEEDESPQDLDAYYSTYGQTSSFEAQYPDYPDYARYQTAKSGLSVEEPSPSTGVQRTDSIDQVLQSAQRDVISRYNSKQYQQRPSRWTPSNARERLVKIQEEATSGEKEASESEEPSEYEEQVVEAEQLEEQDDDDDNDDESTSYILAPEDLTPHTLQQIDASIDVVHIPEKGRCVFAKKTFRPGDIIFIELPTLVAVPSIAPELWETLKGLNSRTPFDLPPIWHLASLYALTQLPRSQQNIILDKWVPEPNRPPSKDVLRVLSAVQLKVDPYRYERFLQAWRYNSFGHHVESDGLVLYNRISMIAHDCSATATWHYGDDDAFVLRARQFIPAGDEITISYIGDDDLFKATHIRQEKLSGWLFTCQCSRCLNSSDTARGFRCPCCGSGITYFRTEKAPDDAISDGVTSATPCTVCQRIPSSKTIRKYLDFEEAYIARLDETDKTDLPDAELVFSEAQRVFNQHWVLHALDTILFEAYRDASRWHEAATHQQRRIQYVSQAMPKASYTLAWLYEEMGDVVANGISSSFHVRSVPVTGFQMNVLAEKYETAMNMLFVLCGSQHTYTLAAHKKLANVFAAPLSR